MIALLELLKSCAFKLDGPKMKEVIKAKAIILVFGFIIYLSILLTKVPSYGYLIYFRDL